MPKVHDEPFCLPLLKCGLAGPRLSRIPGLPNKPDASEKIKRIVPKPIRLVDWVLIESAEKKATEVLSRGGKTPMREAVCELTRLILKDLEKK